MAVIFGLLVAVITLWTIFWVAKIREALERCEILGAEYGSAFGQPELFTGTCETTALMTHLVVWGIPSIFVAVVALMFQPRSTNRSATALATTTPDLPVRSTTRPLDLPIAPQRTERSED